MASTPHPTPRRAAAAALGVTALLAACTAPDGGAGPVLDATFSAVGDDGGETAAAETPTVPADRSEQSVRAADGSQTRVSAGSADLLTEVPVVVPLVAGDADLVQVSGDGDRRTSYVVITSPGATADVWTAVTDDFAEAGFLTEAVSPDDGAPVATAAGVFSGDGYRVTVGLAPAGRASTTVTYLVVPTP